MSAIHLQGKKEQRLLLFLENCLVENGGAVDTRSIPAKDFQIIEQWAKIGLIKFGRMHPDHLAADRTHWVSFDTDTNAAWSEAHRLRIEMARTKSQKVKGKIDA